MRRIIFVCNSFNNVSLVKLLKAVRALYSSSYSQIKQKINILVKTRRYLGFVWNLKITVAWNRWKFWWQTFLQICFEFQLHAIWLLTFIEFDKNLLNKGFRNIAYYEYNKLHWEESKFVVLKLWFIFNKLLAAGSKNNYFFMYYRQLFKLQNSFSLSQKSYKMCIWRKIKRKLTKYTVHKD